MYFGNFHELWSMAGHGAYVWAAYAITFVTLTALLRLPLRASKRQHSNLRAFYRRQGATPTALED
ncbi:MAG: heme exporter protein D [Bermanella sp.]|jgi:heme exporter protein D